MRKPAFLPTILLSLSLTIFLALSAGGAEKEWRTTFDETCGQSNEAMAFSVDELTTLIEKCDRLQKVIEAEDETVRKVYLKRLQLCKNLYVFVLETKKMEQSPK